MTFGQALELIKQGKRVRRKGWTGFKRSVYLVPSFKGWTSVSTGGGPVLISESAERRESVGFGRAAWMPTMADLLAEDWQQAKD